MSNIGAGDRAERGVAMAPYEGIRVVVRLNGSAKWPAGLERRGSRWTYVFGASERTISERKVKEFDVLAAEVHGPTLEFKEQTLA